MSGSSFLVRVLSAVAIALVVSFEIPSARAVQPDEVLSDAGLEARARSLSAELRCVVCQNQSIDDSDAPLARDLRLLVRERLTAGDTDAQAMEFIVARYGEFVLLRPRFGVHTAVLWLLPLVVLILAILGLWRARLFRSRNGVAGPAKSSLTDLEERQLADVLERSRGAVSKD